MKLRLYQKYYIKCLFLENKIHNYLDALEKFNVRFKENLILNEENIRKIKNEIFGGVNNLTLEELCKSLAINDNDIRIDIYPIKTEYLNPKSKDSEIREQNIILIGRKNMIKYLDQNICTQYGIDATFKIIPRSLKPYKLLTIYAIDPFKNRTLISTLICIKYTDKNSLDLLFRQLTASFNFSPICVTTDYDNAQISALKNCELFKKPPYILCCLFHFSQSLVKKFKELKIIKKKFTKRS